MKRILLFLATNVAVVLVLPDTVRPLGLFASHPPVEVRIAALQHWQPAAAAAASR